MFKDRTVTWWMPWREDDETAWASECFGSEVFVPADVWRDGAPTGYTMRMSDLITEYINNKCTAFRQHKYGPEFGLFLCQAEMELGDHPNWKRVDEFRIFFSYLDQGNREVRLLEDLHLPTWLSSNLRHSGWEVGPTTMLSAGTALVHKSVAASGTVPSYADCFTDHFRNRVLPDEIATGQLQFTVGEIASYLLYWTTVRLIATDQKFFERLGAWQRAFRGGDTAAESRLFEALMGGTVKLRPHEGLKPSENRADRTQEQCARVLSTPDAGAPFRSLITGYWLSRERPARPGTDFATYIARFLEQEFGTGMSARRSVAESPMFRDLGWSWPTEHLSTDDDPEALLKVILTALFPEPLIKSGPTADPNAVTKEYRDLAESLEARCVFPMALALSYWPHEATYYSIVPIWGSEVNRKHLPVIFAHVFRASSQFVEASAAAGPVLPMVHLFGRAIADFYYQKYSIAKIAWESADAWAHEIPNYLKSPISDLEAVRYAQCPDQTSRHAHIVPDAPALLERALRRLTALSKVSKTVQSSISARLGNAREDELAQTQPLPAQIAKELIISALNEHFEQKVSVGDDINWAPDPAAASEARRKVFEYYLKLKSVEDYRKIVSEAAAKPPAIREQHVKRMVTQHEIADDGERIRAAEDGYMEALQKPAALQVYAVLREAVGNIRSIAPALHPGIRSKVKVRWKFKIQRDVIQVLLVQTESIDPAATYATTFPGARGASIVIEAIRGVQFANRVFGPEGAGFGEINVGEVKRIGDPALGERYELITNVMFRTNGD